MLSECQNTEADSYRCMQYHADDADDDYDHDDTCNISNVGVNDVEHSGKSLQVEPSL